MPTILHKLEENPEDHAVLHDTYRDGFLEGQCYAFALALNRGLGWPLVGLMKGDLIWHAGVRSPDGKLFDVRGFLTEQEFAEYYLSPPFTIREITASELHATRPVDDYSIERARKLAEVLWPDLPWVESLASKAQAFADELEALCRKHGFWICGDVPANPPRLFMGDGEEGGYVLKPMMNGTGYTIDRYFL